MLISIRNWALAVGVCVLLPAGAFGQIAPPGGGGFPGGGGGFPGGGGGGLPGGGGAGQVFGQTVGGLAQLGLQSMPLGGQPALGPTTAGVYLHAQYMQLYGLPINFLQPPQNNGGGQGAIGGGGLGGYGGFGGGFGGPAIFGINYQRQLAARRMRQAMAMRQMAMQRAYQAAAMRNYMAQRYAYQQYLLQQQNQGNPGSNYTPETPKPQERKLYTGFGLAYRNPLLDSLAQATIAKKKEEDKD